jgi:hypothetical protein
MTERAEHPDYEPDLNFKKAKAESDAQQRTEDIVRSNCSFC